MNEINHLDIDLLQGYKESLGEDVLLKMLDMYEQQSEIYLSDIENSVLSNSQQLWHEHCHKMKGAAGSVGLLKVNQLLASIDKVVESQSWKNEQFRLLNSLNVEGLVAFKEWLND